ncbi:hypothetical protein [Nannocystis punicea]|uniref:Outer membrane protein beta-barrel domain-containing protein n=1 Tax=Nannocystis punicea TaxID=2995304 RepID=A0ABY7HA56_9BACT|nr:hypothetical protein [Nannocystis poenicansa]WAS96146.1 hypothetical protein O0S08_08285 [Nannocystis poenicansa]
MRLVALILALGLSGPAQAAELPPWEPQEVEVDPSGANSAGPDPRTGESNAGAESRPGAAETGEANAGAAGSRSGEANIGAGSQTGEANAGASGGPANGGTANVQSAAPRVAGDDLPPLPIDPNDAPFMRPPNNQIATEPPRTRPDIRQGWSARRRFALTVAPTYAMLRLPFQGRTTGNTPPRIHGAGVGAEFDVQAWRWIWVRAIGVYSGHPVGEERAQMEMEVVRTAPPGTIHVMGFGAGPVFALDLGRFLPLIEVGVAGLRVVTPTGGVTGQRGEACLANGACDVGLKCNSERICEVTTIGEMYLGLAVDLLVRRHFSFGAQFRYNVRFAELKSLNLTPGYLLGTLRLTVRF